MLPTLVRLSAGSKARTIGGQQESCGNALTDEPVYSHNLPPPMRADTSGVDDVTLLIIREGFIVSGGYFGGK